MIEQLKEAAKGVDLNDLALDIENMIQERLKSLVAWEQLDPMLIIFGFLATRGVWRASQEIQDPLLRELYLLINIPAVGEDFKQRLDNVANNLQRDPD